MYTLLLNALEAIYFFLPAYFANATPTMFGGGTPIDFQHNFLDGNRLLGDSKTIRGFVSGIVAGTTVGFIQNFPLKGVVLSLGALFGDLAGSFFKRRLNFRPGDPMPILDQLDFVAGALLLGMNFYPISLSTIILLTVLTPFIHLFMNIIAYLLKVKSKPW
jgi:CDP-2,3-bis-(O-geranylgeranyl)-sn-glycerol synthase